ncbi:hypothetical protein JTE90_023389 [Oedothorax gibbosus]|uniref:cystathionine gamma-lyase n=1 Tax=Oedothorax gibbosus TaxID=931172 RepID=A0AAV6UEY8_9ARAC|nr:hypothetical protein JTE90_023389 [Oedothorax gibbosus]
MTELGTILVHGDVFRHDKTETRTINLSSMNDEISAIENGSKKRLEERIALLEHAKYALCFSCGTAAVSSISMLLENGDHVVMFNSVYHGTRNYLKIKEALGSVEVTFADLREASTLENLMKENTKMVWIETPCNPTMKIVDIDAVAKIVKKHQKSFLVVDNTFMSPYFQNPLLLGADISMHSLTKYMNGHSDVLMGAAATNNDEIYAKLKSTSQLVGSLPSPLDCYLVLRGLKTLHLRMEQHMRNATAVARFLETHPNVERVFYPGLESHPQYQVAIKQCRGFSGMVSFCIKGGTDETRRFAEKIKIFTLAVSLGSAESLIDIPSLMTASALSKEMRKELEVTDNLIRLSIGLESAEDLIEDLNQALS